MRSVTTCAVAALFAVCFVAACGSAASEPPTEAAAFHPIPADPVVVNGTATCDLSMEGVDPETGGPGWRVVCELDMSDPRVNGTEVHDRIRIVYGGEVGDVWVAEEATITNAEGTWRGTVQAADDGWPTGEAHYIGEGAYEGLEFHYYFSVTGSEAPEGDESVTDLKRGWISGGE